MIHPCTWILMLWIKTTNSANVEYKCETAYSCAGEVINHTPTDIPNQHVVQVRGYKAAYGYNTSIETNVLECSGAFGCSGENQTLLYAASNTNIGNVQCDGAHSCAQISSLSATDKSDCRAFKSCQSTHFNGWLQTVNCWGDQSCANAQFNNVSTIIAQGAYSLMNATINSTNDLYVTLYGHHSGFAAKIWCQSQHTCTINCFDTGCEMLFIECTNDNCIINNNSNVSILPIHALSFFDDSQFNVLTQTNFNNKLCNVSFDDYAMFHTAGELIQTSNVMCCRGSRSCYNLSLIQTNAVLMCSGGRSCLQSNIISNNAVICDGFAGCQSNTVLRQNMTAAGDIYCTAHSACQYRNINATNGQRIYCSGYYSCMRTTFVSNGDMYIHFFGYKSADRSYIYCNIGDTCFIYCHGALSCHAIETFMCIGECVVDCNEDTACPNISTVAPTSFHPSVSPTLIPTNPTRNPTRIPSIQPTNSVQTSTHSSSVNSWVVIIIALCVVVILICVFIM
eukprot:219835_1